MTNITNLNKDETFTLHNGDEYWNPSLKKDFIDGVSTLWDKSYVDEGIGKDNLFLEEEYQKTKA